jgi:hypothetical protein
VQVRKHFKPEFVNRIDEFIIFEPLRSDEIRQIVKLRMTGVIKRLAERKMVLDLRESAIDHLAKQGFDPVFGARPVKRVIQRELETTLARSLLRGDFVEGDTIVVTRPAPDQKGNLLFRRVPAGGVLPLIGDEGTAPAVPAPARGSSGSEGAASNGGPPAAAPAATGGAGAGATTSAAEVVSAPPRALKFDPLRKISNAATAGADLSQDGAAARADPSTLPTSEG